MRVTPSMMLVVLATALGPLPGLATTDADTKAVERIWKAGESLPASLTARFPNPPLEVPNDTGLNVLVDLGLPNRAAYKKWSNGKVWQKLWWVWQKLDDRYGTTWYPRWRWVQSTRWQDDRGRKLSMDEMVEDMSIACGEDLFPFFKKIGTTLKQDRLEKVVFEGKTVFLPVATLEVSPAGNAKHDPIGDYQQPLPRPI